MEKYVRVNELNKDKPTVYTAEEIADAVRGVDEWVWNGSIYVCGRCGCGARDPKNFCGYCGSRNR